MGRCVYSGRNWEGFSPDPYLSGVAMELGIKGLQDAGVQAVAKHLVANERKFNAILSIIQMELCNLKQSRVMWTIELFVSRLIPDFPLSRLQLC
jgi:hypothetical protein